MSFPFGLDHSLAFTAVGHPVRIGHIAFQSIADYCESLDIHPGDRVQCRASDVDNVLLRKESGSEVVVDRRLAMFVEVEPDARPLAPA